MQITFNLVVSLTFLTTNVSLKSTIIPNFYLNSFKFTLIQNLIIEDTVNDLYLAGSFERRSTKNHHKHYNSSCPDVTFFPIRFTQNFRCYIISCPYSSCQDLILALFVMSNSKINNFDCVCLFVD